MTKATLNPQKAEMTRNYLIDLLGQLTVDYQNTKQDRKEIAVNFPASEEEFTVLEEIELLTGDLRGYASQIQARGWIEKEKEARERLEAMRVSDIPALAQFYFGTDGDYRQMKAYLQKLDYLRLLILEYLRDSETSESCQDLSVGG